MYVKLKKHLCPYFFLFLAAISVSACSKDASKKELSNAEKPFIVTTTGMLADLAQNIGKDSVNVKALMGPGVDPHLFKATQGDLATLRQANIIFYNGLHLEGKMGEIFEKLARLKTVIAVAERIPEERLFENADYQGNYDPHIWFDVALWSEGIAVVRDQLIELDSASASYYTQNAEAYLKELTALDIKVREQLAQLPESQRILITAHDAFNYFGRAYGIEVRGLQGISTLSEFGLRDRVELVDFIIEKKIKAIFVETSVSKKNIESIIEGCMQKGHQVRIGGSLYSDAMGEEGSPSGNYIGMVKANVETIVSSLE
jgi:manganese/zinc/iron transport system substrate-binding protein